jgi:pimeloyl-ACP methyl ester carboxylesterase
LAFVLGAGTWWFSSALHAQDSETCISEDISLMPCPILFIHSKDDSYVPFGVAFSLFDKAQKGQLWEIEAGRSEHTYHHLKLQAEYHKQVSSFMKECCFSELERAEQLD